MSSTPANRGTVKHICWIVLAAVVCVSACDVPTTGRDEDADDDDAATNSDTDSDTDSDSDSDSESDTDGDTGYPPGPYGFNPSATYETTFGPVTWTGDGEVIPDVCLENALGDEVCLADHYGSATQELLFVDFTTMW